VHRATSQVDGEIVADDQRWGRRLPPGQRPDPGDQLGEGERLGQVVVGAHAQAGHPVLHAGGRGQHEDPARRVSGGQRTAHVVAVDSRQVAVEYHDVVVQQVELGQRARAVERDVHREPDVAQPVGQVAGQHPLVLDDQHPHRPSVSRRP
jgi:hypothetical protein